MSLIKHSFVNLFECGKSLQRCRFRALLEEYEYDLGNPLLHTKVRWLSRAKFSKISLDFLPEINKFMTSVNKSYPQLKDDNWIHDLPFLYDITGKLNKLNLELPEKNKTLTFLEA